MCFVECDQIILLLQVSGTRGDDKGVKEKPSVTEASSSKSERTSSSVSASSKKKKQHKVNDEPKFSTKLTVPIETIIEETLNEELSDSHSSTTERAAISKPRRKKKSSKKEKNKSPSSAQEQPDFKESDFVFVKSKKSVDKESKNTASTVVEPAPAKSVTNKSKTAKGKSLLEKQNSAEALTSVIAQSITKKRDPLSTPIIEHYKSSATSYVEVKESKKVCPKVSYASVVTNNIPADETQTVNANECLEENSPNSELPVYESNVTDTEVLKPVQTEQALLTIPAQPELPQEDQYFPDTIKEIDEILKEEFGELCSEGTSSPEYLVGGSENGDISEQESDGNLEDPLQDLEDEIIEQPFIVEECEVEVLSVKENSALDIPQVNEQTTNQDQTDQNPFTEGVVNDCLNQSLWDLLEDQISHTPIPEVQNTAEQDQTDKKPSIECVGIELLKESLQNQVTETPFPQVNTAAEQSVENNFVTQNLEELSEDQQVKENIVNQDQTDKDLSIKGSEPESFSEVNEETVYQEKQNSSIENFNKNLTDLLEEQIQSLEDQIIQKSFVIEESEIVYPVNSVSDNCEDTVIQNTFAEVPQDIEKSEEMASQIRILTLNDKEHQECTIYRIEKKVILQFRLGPTLLGQKIRLYCNYPVEINGKLGEFERTTYQELSWCQDEGCKHSDDTASFAEIIPTLAGSFHYYFVYEEG